MSRLTSNYAQIFHISTKSRIDSKKLSGEANFAKKKFKPVVLFNENGSAKQ